MTDSKFSKLERLLLSNQYKILEKLYPDEADYYSQHRIALEKGYELNYSWAFDNIYDGLSEEGCREVIDILNMYRVITFSAKELEIEQDFRSHPWFIFPGFDGNNESSQLSYCRYFIVELGRFNELRREGDYQDFNSHAPTLCKYRAMLREFRKAQSGDVILKPSLTKEEISRILDTGHAIRI